MSVMRSVMAGRPMPLKKPSSDHSAMPSGAASMRGNQYARARSRVSLGMPKGEKIQNPVNASTANAGTVNSEAHSAVQVACEARA